MRTLVIILTAIIIILCVVLAINYSTQQSNYKREKQKLEKELRQAFDSIDSLSRSAQSFRDSFEVQLQVNRSIMSQVQERDKRIVQLNKNIRDIKLVKFSNDSQRDSILHVLYPELYEK